MNPDERSAPGPPGSDGNTEGADVERGDSMGTQWRLDFGWKRMSFLTRLLLVCTAALVLATLVVQVTGIQLPAIPQQTQQDRERAVQVMQEQLQLLPPFPGSLEKGKLVVTSAGHGPFVDVDYSTDARCAAVQSYYTSAAPAEGWTMTMPPRSTGHLSEVDSTYQKPVDGLSIKLTVSCYSDPAADGDGYSLATSV